MSKYKYKAVIFDLDGTLLDTLDDLMNSVNYSLLQNELPARSKEEIRKFVGNGVKKLMMRASGLPDSDSRFEKIFGDFKEHYGKHCNDCTKLYPGIKEMLVQLKEDNVKTAIVSNKADFGVQALKNIYFDKLIMVAKGESETIKKKPSPDMVMAALDELEVEPQDCVYVGDSDVDIETAINSKMDVISVTWGFRDKEFLIANGGTRFANNTHELVALLGSN